jgi:hypothetical protein
MLTPFDGLYCVWFINLVSVFRDVRAHLSTLRLKTETETCLRNVVFLNIRTMVNVQNCDSYTLHLAYTVIHEKLSRPNNQYPYCVSREVPVKIPV